MWTKIDAYIAISVDLDDGERSFGGKGEFGFLFSLILFLFYEDFVTYLVNVWDVRLIFLFIVGNGLAVALQFHHLPVNFGVLSENHIHAKGKLAGIVRWVWWAGGPNCPCAGLDEVVYILMPIINGVNWGT